MKAVRLKSGKSAANDNPDFAALHPGYIYLD
jgi:hypothetical protein